MIKDKFFFTAHDFAYYAWFVFLIICFLPLIIYGGFGTSDDLSLIVNTSDSYTDALKQSLSRSGHVSRPIYGFVQISSLFVFKAHHFLYTIYRLLLWAVNIYLICHVFKFTLIGVKKIIFLFLISFPIFISAHFFNAFQTGYLWSVFFWLISLVFIKKCFNDNGLYNLKISTCFLLLALLSCEIVFPLFILNILLPLSDKGVRFHFKSKSSVLKKHMLMVLLVLISFAFFKMFIAPLYQTETGIYGFSFSFHSILQSVYYFFCILIEIPLLLLEVIPFYISMPLLWITLITFPLFYFLRKEVSLQKENDEGQISRINKYLFCALFSCFLIFLFSEYPAVTFGNYNKMLLPSFVVYCLFVTKFFHKILYSKLWFFVPFLISLWISSMLVQVKNTCESWSLRNEVSIEIAKQVKTLPKSPNKKVLCNVPFYLKNNYNDEHVFWTTWDFEAGIKYIGFYSDFVFLPYCENTIKDPSLDSFHNINNKMNKYHNEAVWNFVYSKQRTQNSILLHNDFQSLKSSRISFNNFEPCFRHQLRNKIKTLF